MVRDQDILLIYLYIKVAGMEKSEGRERWLQKKRQRVDLGRKAEREGISTLGNKGCFPRRQCGSENNSGQEQKTNFLSFSIFPRTALVFCQASSGG